MALSNLQAKPRDGSLQEWVGRRDRGVAVSLLWSPSLSGSMLYRTIGSPVTEISALGFGCSRLGSVGSGITARVGIRLLHQAHDLGITLFDTANIYGQGDSERMLGKAFRRRREQVVIVTKAGYRFRGVGRLTNLAKPLLRRVAQRMSSVRRSIAGARSGALDQRFEPAYIRRSFEESLTRLGTDHVDLFMLHSVPKEELGSGPLFEALEQLKSQGKLRHYGVSMSSFPPGVASLLPAGVEVAGSAVNPMQGDNLDQLGDLAERVSILGYQPFGSGALFSATDPDHDLWRQRLQGVANQNGLSLAQTLVQFSLQQAGVSSVVMGASSEQHLKELVAALEPGNMIEGPIRF